jgi:hypothetical protein
MSLEQTMRGRGAQRRRASQSLDFRQSIGTSRVLSLTNSRGEGDVSLIAWLLIGGSGIAGFIAAAAYGSIWKRAREQKRREARVRLQALAASDALCDAFEPLIQLSRDLLDHASVSNDAPKLVAARVAELRARAVNLDARVTADAEAQHDTRIGVDVGKMLEALRVTERALEEVYLFARRSTDAHSSEQFRTQARYAAAQIGELARRLAELRASIREREVTLRQYA